MANSIASLSKTDKALMLDGIYRICSTPAFTCAVERHMTGQQQMRGYANLEPIQCKVSSTLDVLSGGRAYLGIGAAWFEREALGLGGLFPALKERIERLEEALQIAKQMWSGQIAPFQGSYHETKKAPRLEGLGRALRRQARPAPSVARQT